MLRLIDVVIYSLFALVITFLVQVISQTKQKRSELYIRQRPWLTMNVREKQMFFWTAVAILLVCMVLFCSFRRIGEGYGGTDSPTYLDQFNNSTGYLREQFVRFRFRDWEPMHTLALWLVRKYTDNYRVFLIIQYFIYSLLFIRYALLLDLDRRSTLSTFVLVLFFLDSFSAQRNTFAALVSLLVFECIYKKKYTKSVLLAILATLFHYSGFILFFAIGCSYFWRKIRGSYSQKLVVYTVFVIFVSALSGNILTYFFNDTRYSYYMPSINLPYGMIMMYLLILMLSFYLHDELRKDRLSLDLTVWYVSMIPSYVFQLYYPIMYRTMLYMLPASYILLWKYKQYLGNKKSTVSYVLYCGVNCMLLIRALQFFTTEVPSYIGQYANILLMA